MAIPETVAVEQRWYARLIARAKEVPAAAAIIVHPCDETELRGAAESAEAGLIKPTLIGPSANTRGLRMNSLSISLAWQSLMCPQRCGLRTSGRTHSARQGRTPDEGAPAY
jgi:hypothetical protein